jgi:hypothetical protein
MSWPLFSIKKTKNAYTVAARPRLEKHIQESQSGV